MCAQLFKNAFTKAKLSLISNAGTWMQRNLPLYVTTKWVFSYLGSIPMLPPRYVYP